MFRIRKVYDLNSQDNIKRLEEVQLVLKEQFPGLREEDILGLKQKLFEPLNDIFRYALFIASEPHRPLKGFALLSFNSKLKFCFLDYVSTTKHGMNRGVGGALYDRVREEAIHLKALGIFCECLPDDPLLCSDPLVIKQNQSRLKFYERYGAFPVINTKYETPLKPEDDNPPYLVFDGLGNNPNLAKSYYKQVVKSILDHKYPNRCPDAYVKLVLDSIVNDPIQLRTPRYLKKVESTEVAKVPSLDRRIILVVNDRHEIHHVKDRGYVESPVRIAKILASLDKENFFEKLAPKTYSEKYLYTTHDKDYVNYFQKVCDKIEDGKSVYPYVFPLRNQNRKPVELPILAGYYCIDTFTPLNKNAYLAAKRAVDCALTCADSILEGFRAAYALVRPPGHHAEYRAFGGFCYFNSAAICAQYLSTKDLSGQGKVAILDIDYHHGNGQQDIFYKRADILTVSIHGHPRFAYPYYTGFEDETGEEQGVGYNINMPLQENIKGEEYRVALNRAIKKIKEFNPTYLVVCLGLDPAKGDPTGTWSLLPADFFQNGQIIASLSLPTVFVQEGGYKTNQVGENAAKFMKGYWEATFK